MKPFYHWWSFYQSIRDPSWPECVNEHEFHELHPLIRHEIVTTFNGSQLAAVQPSDIVDYPQHTDFRVALDPVQAQDDAPSLPLDKSFRVSRDFDVLYNDSIDGQGTLYCQFFPKVLRYLYPSRVFDRGLEWCSGAGFIGFRLLSDGIIRDVTMMDRHRPALVACQSSWAARPARLTSSGFDTVHGSQVAALAHRQFDLIVANPPNFDDGTWHPGQARHRLTQDPGWMIHDDFFRNIGSNLAKDGVILLIKNIHGSQPTDHAAAIKDGGLEIRRVFTYSQQEYEYYLEITHA